MNPRKFLPTIAIAAMAASAARAGDEPPPVPVTRPEIKQVLEGSKHSRPRLPLPPLTDEEKHRAEGAPREGQPRGMGGGIVNNGRMRN